MLKMAQGITPVVTWNTPANIVYGTALDSTQLNASCNIAGEFIYTPLIGTVLNAGTQSLRVDFTPTDTKTYITTSKTVIIEVAKANSTITWNNPTDITYGTSLSTTQLNAMSNVAGIFVYSPVIGTSLNAGNLQSLSVTFTPTDSENYNSSSKSVSINVAKAEPVISWSNPADIISGVALSTTQLNATASVPGSFVYNPVSGTILGVGTGQSLLVTFTPADSTNYTTATKAVSINVTSQVSQVLYNKSVAFGDTDKAGMILFKPTANITFNTMKMQEANLTSSFQNFVTAISELTDNKDGTFTISSYKYLAEGGAGLTKTTTGRTIDGYEVFDIIATYNAAYNLNSWNGVFSADHIYGIVMSNSYEDSKLGSGSYSILKGLLSWQVYSKVTGITLTQDVIKLYNIIT